MKVNSLKILTWLFSDNLQQPFVSTYDQLYLVFPELTAGGLRSMVKHLVELKLIRTETLLKQTTISLTTHGVAELERQFPVFWHRTHRWDGKWSCLVFLNAPKTDEGFRYLRTVLLGERALQLSRGVYLFAGPIPEKVQRISQELYVGSVTMFSIDAWQFGDERSTIVDSFSLTTHLESYSGISKSINQLLSVKNVQKGSYQTLKNEISSVFDRLYEVINQDSGLTSYYFGNSIDPIQLLQRLQQLLDPSKLDV